jgi:hypothetical protein
LILHGFDVLKSVEMNHEKFKVEQETMEFLPAVSNFDPVDTYGTSIAVTIQTVTLPLSDEEQVISLG